MRACSSPSSYWPGWDSTPPPLLTPCPISFSTSKPYLLQPEDGGNKALWNSVLYYIFLSSPTRLHHTGFVGLTFEWINYVAWSEVKDGYEWHGKKDRIKAVLVSFKIMSWHLPGGIEGCAKNSYVVTKTQTKDLPSISQSLIIDFLLFVILIY